MSKSYGINNRVHIETEMEHHVENVALRGYSIMRNVVSLDKAERLKEKLNNIYTVQINEVGKENLDKINEKNIVRTPLAYDPDFLDLITHPKVKEFTRKMLGDNYILNLQNAVINLPNFEHHQSSWHRDLPYQNFVISSPLAVNAFYCLSPFNESTGGTVLLPFSHQMEYMPSKRFVEENLYHVQADTGDVILFDSMVFHRAGKNVSNISRVGVNNMFTKPLISQQINLPQFLDGAYSDDEDLNLLLGYKFEAPNSVLEYRKNRIIKS